MEKNDYEFFWDKYFNPLIQEILFKTGGQVRSSDLKANLYKQYQKYRSQVHMDMQDPKGRIDRHKIAAIFCKSIMDLDPFIVDKSQTLTHRFLKEYIGFRVGLTLIYAFLKVKNQKYPGNAEYALIVKKYFQFPNSDHGDYEHHILKTLRNSAVNNSFNIYKLSNIYFLIEAFSVQYHRLFESRV
jgi:hypothetical protein